jgi:hypothetical protein
LIITKHLLLIIRQQQPVDKIKKTVFFQKFSFQIGLHKFSTSEETLFESNRGNSYRCYAQTQIKDFQTNGTISITSIDLENLKIQPFVDDSKEFDTYDTGKFSIEK